LCAYVYISELLST